MFVPKTFVPPLFDRGFGHPGTFVFRSSFSGLREALRKKIETGKNRLGKIARGCRAHPSKIT